MGNGRSFVRKITFTVNLLLWLAFLLGLAIAYTPITHYLLTPLAVTGDVRNADCIVVLGGGNEGEFLGLVSSHRLMRGIEIFHEGRAKTIVVSGGTAQEGEIAEAPIMSREARKFRIPAEAIVVEAKSTRTAEEAAEIRKMADAREWKSVILVTSFVHMKRSVMVFEHAGFKVYPAPAGAYELHIKNPMGRLNLFFQVIHEYGGIVYYKFRGWI